MLILARIDLDFVLHSLLPVAATVCVLGILRRVLMGQSLEKKRRRREENRLRCQHCGYDLRGLNYPRCPECGTIRGFDMPIDELPLTDEERKMIDDCCRGGPKSPQPPDQAVPPADE